MMLEKTGVLLVNLGTPEAPTKSAVKKYLKEFLLDPRVIDSSFFIRQLLVRFVIIPRRINETTSFYRKIWSKEGSPLMVHSLKLKEKLSIALSQNYHVELAMRYQSPSIKEGLEKLKFCKKIIILPLFPQYASATTGSLYQEAMKQISSWVAIPEIHFISSFPNQDKMIEAFADRARAKDISSYDHILISFHGLPVRHILKGSKDQQCFKSGSCCEKLTPSNKLCYRAECYATAKALAKALELKSDQYSLCFQSRLGKEPWLEPYASDHIKKLAALGKKKILVFCPSFVADCIETIHEIGVEYAKEFKSYGGESLELVESLNDHPLWIEALQDLIQKPN